MRNAAMLVFFLMMLGMIAHTDARCAGISPDDLKPPQSGYLQIIRTVDGSSMIGRVTGVENDTVVFDTGIGVLRVPLGRIRSIRVIPETDVRGGEYRVPSPNDTRLFFAPTGRMLKRGEGYFADYYVFFPSFNYGVTDRLSLGGGLSIFPTGSMKNQIYFFTPKIGLMRSPNLNIAAGALVIRLPHTLDENLPTLSVLYGAGTYGSSDRSVTLGIGYGFADRKAGTKPVFVLGGEYRLGRMISAVTENWYVPGAENALSSLGVRFFGEDLAADLAFLRAVGKDNSPGIPYVDFVWHF
jgi:hypothetical protein